MKNKKEKVEISFLGGMSEEVTGSCSRIIFRDKTILVDIGLCQSEHTVYGNYISNRDFLRKIKPKDVDVVIISHAHADHIGLLPALFKNPECQAKVYVAKNSKNIMKEMLLDSAGIMERDTLMLSEQKGKSFEPFYIEKDVYKCIDAMIEVNPLENIAIEDGVSLQFLPNAHILLSQQIKLTFDTVPVRRKVVFTGDLGNNINLPDKFYMDGFVPVSKCDLLISESTYGASSKRNSFKDYKKDLEKFKSVVEQFTSIGTVLIPSFSLDRTPFFMWLVYTMFKDNPSFNIPVLVDSPLAIRLLKCYQEILSGEKSSVFEEMMNWKNFKFITDPEESKHWVSSSQHKLVLSASGMLQQGRSVKYLKEMLPNANDCILMAGYMGEGTLGWKIKNGKENKTISIQGKLYKNRCTVVGLNSFSGHMQHEQLKEYLLSVNTSKIVLIHGDMNGKLELKHELEDGFKEQYRTTKVVAANKSTKITLD